VMPDEVILSIEDLTVAYRSGDIWLEAVRDFSLQIGAQQTYGLVGESGSGKSTIALAIMRYLSEGGAVCKGRIRFRGQDLLSLNNVEMQQVWGRHMGMVPLNPYR
jgi:peptide/nickel transport system ATP-binding protein